LRLKGHIRFPQPGHCEDGSQAGILLFAEKPELIKPQFVVKAIRFPGNQIHVTDYSDTEDFSGPLSKVFEDSLAFVMRNLHKIQAGRGVNAPGTPEIPAGVFEELLVNALVHRDYLVSAPIRLFIFDNRIESISPGHLPNNLTVEKIRTGNSNIRNSILVSYAAMGLLPYHGLGSGIKRALEEWSDISFVDDRDGCLFTSTIARSLKGAAPKKTLSGSDAPINVPETANLSGHQARQNDLLNDLLNENADLFKVIRKSPGSDYLSYAKLIGASEATVKRHIQKLKSQDIVRRVGSKKTGHWEINLPVEIEKGPIT
jgi:ATP-dependent DNA helicase RecG